MKLEDYQRIFRTIYSFYVNIPGLLRIVQDGPTIFSIIGSKILNDIYQIDCEVKAGFFAFNYDLPHAFAAGIYDEKTKKWKNPYCWVEFDDKVVDFLAPIYESRLYLNSGDKIYRKMFFKDKKASKKKLPMKNEGDFMIIENRELTLERLDWFNKDIWANWLLDACLTWFQKPPKIMRLAAFTNPENNSPLMINFDTTIKINGRW